MEDKDAAIETLRERMGLAEQAEAEAGHERRETERVLRAERDDLAGRMGRVEAEVRSVLAEVARAEGDVGMVVDGSNEAAARVEQVKPHAPSLNP
ncbi:hypothetical protein T484DRAFT_2084456 [Baffinella frigidus]|nr:hypothetical protein T484DRAFT_2084456 [Cryptophyta sp. CCMP2293]